MSVPGARIGVAALAVFAGFAGPDDEPRRTPVRRPAGLAADASCSVCHPGATEGLARSVHRSVESCAACHVGADAHADSARRPEAELVAPPPVEGASCRTCHADTDWSPALAAHPWVPDSELPSFEPAITPVDLPPRTGLDTFDWEGLLSIGYRFVSTTGSFARYETDVNLEPGLRLVEARLSGTGRSAWLDHVDLRADDIGDPFERVALELGKTDSHELAVDHTERSFVYRAHGDYSRVEHHERTTAGNVDVELSDSLGVFVSVSTYADDGRWLTQRIGGRGVEPITSIADVDSPRRLESNEFSAGLRGNADDFSFRFGAEWLDESLEEEWIYDVPAPSNLAFRAREDFRSASDLEGPGVFGSLSHELGPVRWTADARYRTLDRTVRGRGEREGFDNVEFESSIVSNADGDAETLWLGFDAVAELDDRVAVLFDLRFRDHEEEMRLDQLEVTRFPATGTAVAVRDVRTQRTTQTRLSGTAEVEVELTDEVIASAGWGFSYEELELPDLVLGDADPTGGTLRENGVILGAEWRIDDAWRLRGRYTDFGQTGLQLYEPQEDESRQGELTLRYRQERAAFEVFARHRRAENDASSFRSRWTSLGASGSWSREDGVDLFASYTWTDVDSQTLTTFWFDPDPVAVPTIVGFEGVTHTGALGFRVDPTTRLGWRNDAVVTSTSGSFDVDTAQLRSDLRFDLLDASSIGVRYQWITYHDQFDVDDYDAHLVMVYWSQRFGGSRR